jgi:hypothetical protein
MQTAEGVAGPEQVLSDREEEDSDDESSPFNQLVDAALGLAAEEGGNLAGEQQQQRQRPTRQSRASAHAAGLSLEDCVIDADMEQDQQRVARVRGQSAAAAAALGQAGGTTGAEVGGTTAAGRKRKVLCL